MGEHLKEWEMGLGWVSTKSSNVSRWEAQGGGQGDAGGEDELAGAPMEVSVILGTPERFLWEGKWLHWVGVGLQREA